jgi:4-hydroxybenzoate polyprenyltransferase
MKGWLSKWLPLVIAGLVAIVGASLAFAIDDGHLRAKPFGLILLAAAGLVIAGWVVNRWYARRPVRRAPRTGSPAPATGVESVKAIGGLIAVLFAVGAIVALFVLTISLKSGFTADSAIAFATSAFGVISAITAAYLGIKITSDQAAGTQQAAGLAQAQAAVAQAPEGAAKEKAQTDLAQAAVQAQTARGA